MNKRCIGCGKILQDQDKSSEGYTPNLKNEYCMRCFRLKNYGEKKEGEIVLEKDFKVIIISNSGKKRLIPFKEGLNVDVSASSHKPFKKKYLKIMDIYKFKYHEIAAIGDQLLTDINGANRVGITSILVNPIGDYEKWCTKINRFFESFIYRKLRKKGILNKGEYYE